MFIPPSCGGAWCGWGEGARPARPAALPSGLHPCPRPRAPGPSPLSADTGSSTTEESCASPSPSAAPLTPPLAPGSLSTMSSHRLCRSVSSPAADAISSLPQRAEGASLPPLSATEETGGSRPGEAWTTRPRDVRLGTKGNSQDMFGRPALGARWQQGAPLMQCSMNTTRVASAR